VQLSLVKFSSAGATFYWNTLRIGSEHEVDEVIDLYTGKQLSFKIVDGKTAKQNGHQNASEDWEYLQIKLLRPVPKGGETRLRIDKTFLIVHSVSKGMQSYCPKAMK